MIPGNKLQTNSITFNFIPLNLIQRLTLLNDIIRFIFISLILIQDLTLC